MNIFLILIIIILLLIIFYMYYNIHNDQYLESFGNFSPYTCNNSYPFVYQKNLDQKLLKKTLKEWEMPFNNNDEGYNTQQYGIPPLTKIYSYEELKKVRFKDIPLTAYSGDI